MKIDKIVPDTSILIEGILSKRIEDKKYKPTLILIHEAVVGELENQANKKREIGNLGFGEITKLKELSKKHKFEIKFTGDRPHPSVIKGARVGEVDAIIRKLAEEEGAYLFTADKVQAKVAEVKGINVILEVF